MNILDEDLARALIDERLASARRAQLRRDATRSGRDEHGTGAARWWQLRLPPSPAPARRWSPTAPRTPEPLERLLDRTADEIVESGTRHAAGTLTALAVATRHLCPGAAAALTDWDGSEPARLRAYGIAHGVALRGLDDRGRARLLAQLTGAPSRIAERATPAVDRPDTRSGRAA